ncbi:N-acetylmuramoyl-L-alanine amidase [Serratia ureilytica]
MLEIANHVRRFLHEHDHVEARLTREEDEFIPLFQRVEIAHQHQADLFHFDSRRRLYQPVGLRLSVFALSNRQQHRGATCQPLYRHDVAGGRSGIRTTTCSGAVRLVQTDTINNSLTLGRHVLGQIRPVHHLHSTTAWEQAAFAVLSPSTIPSVLVETSFVTNPNEERCWAPPRFARRLPAPSRTASCFFDYFDAHQRKPR